MIEELDKQIQKKLAQYQKQVELAWNSRGGTNGSAAKVMGNFPGTDGGNGSEVCSLHRRDRGGGPGYLFVRSPSIAGPDSNGSSPDWRSPSSSTRT